MLQVQCKSRHLVAAEIRGRIGEQVLGRALEARKTLRGLLDLGHVRRLPVRLCKSQLLRSLRLLRLLAGLPIRLDLRLLGLPLRVGRLRGLRRLCTRSSRLRSTRRLRSLPCQRSLQGRVDDIRRLARGGSSLGRLVLVRVLAHVYILFPL